MNSLVWLIHCYEQENFHLVTLLEYFQLLLL